MAKIAILEKHKMFWKAGVNLFVTTTCRRILKHVSKSYDILSVVPDNRKRVIVGLIYNSCRSRKLVVNMSHATNSYRQNRPLKIWQMKYLNLL